MKCVDGRWRGCSPLRAARRPPASPWAPCGGGWRGSWWRTARRAATTASASRYVDQEGEVNIQDKWHDFDGNLPACPTSADLLSATHCQPSGRRLRRQSAPKLLPTVQFRASSDEVMLRLEGHSVELQSRRCRHVASVLAPETGPP